jgi:hypothetical protein
MTRNLRFSNASGAANGLSRSIPFAATRVAA